MSILASLPKNRGDVEATCGEFSAVVMSSFADCFKFGFVSTEHLPRIGMLWKAICFSALLSHPLSKVDIHFLTYVLCSRKLNERVVDFAFSLFVQPC